MKIVVTGSLGHISLPLTKQLTAQGHQVTVISSKEDKKAQIEALGAAAATGSVQDAGFLRSVFGGADAVYTMVPPGNYFDPTMDIFAYYEGLGHNYAEAIQAANVKRVVNLSTFGGERAEGTGILVGAHKVEEILNALPPDVSITHMRPTSFYYNLYAYMQPIKQYGLIAANYGADDVVPWVSPLDIADAVAEELTRPFTGRSVRYVASEELSCNRVAEIIGAAIGKPELKWIIISDTEAEGHLKAIGMNPQIATGMVEMYGAMHSGLLAADYFDNRPVLGKVKMEDFAKEFAAAFAQIN